MKNGLTRFDSNDWGLSVFDKVFDSFFTPFNYHSASQRMLTDVKETEKGFELKVDMPGYEKEDINLTLNDGYLTINAKREDAQEEKGYIKRERSFSCSRTFFVGDKVSEEDIKAKYTNGTLQIDIPKIEKKELPKKNIVID